MFVVEILGEDGQIIGYQVVDSSGDPLGPVGSLKEALAIIQEVLNEFLMDELGDPERSHGHKSTSP